MPTLLETMASGVEARCQAKLAEARREGDAIVSSAKARADESYAKGLESVAAEIRRAAEQGRKLAQSEGEKVVLSAQHSVSDDALADVRRRLASIAASEDFGPMIDALLAQAVGAARGDIEVLAPARFVERCQAWLSSHGHGGVNVRPTSEFDDGVAVQDVKHTYRITNTLTSRYGKLEPRARKLLMIRLFGGESAS
jgi:vacuolar-type H+-ATPase subunit E/Vma4